jgi:hypothetical protein
MRSRCPSTPQSHSQSHSPEFAGVRRDRSRAHIPGHGLSRTVMNAEAHTWKACWGQPLRSSNLLSSATLTCKNIDEWLLPSGLIFVQWAHLMGSFPQPWSLPPPISADVVVLVRGVTDDPERGAHAVKACALPFRAGWDRSRPAGYPLTTDHITLSDREAPGERAPSRRYGRQLAQS